MVEHLLLMTSAGGPPVESTINTALQWTLRAVFQNVLHVFVRAGGLCNFYAAPQSAPRERSDRNTTNRRNPRHINE
jgi:hypothetical protein